MAAGKKLLPPPTWLVANLILEDTDVLIAAPSKFLKTFLAIAFAGSMATGHPTFRKYEVKRKGHVFYCAAEGSLSVRKKRLTAWEIAQGIHAYTADHVHIASAAPLLDGGSVDEFITDALACMNPGERATGFFLDTMNRTLGGNDENSSATASRYLDMLARIRKAIGGSTITIHHMGKDKQKGARGSSAFYAGFDTVIFIDEVTKNEKTGNFFLKAHVDKQKDGEEQEIYLQTVKIMTPDGPSLALELANQDDAKRAAGRQVGIRPKDVGAALKARGACPGDANEWNGKTGGIDTKTLASQIASIRAEAANTGRAPTAKEIDGVVAMLNREARDNPSIAAYVVRERRSGRQWAIAPGTVEEAPDDV